MTGESISNPGFHDRWNCPRCYDLLPVKRVGGGVVVQCTECRVDVRCTLESQPVCVSEVIENEEEDEDE